MPAAARSKLCSSVSIAHQTEYICYNKKATSPN